MTCSRNPAEAAADEDEALRLRERRAWARTEFWVVDDKDGTWRFGGRLPALQAEMLMSPLDAIAAPRRRHLTAEQERDQDELTYSQRMGRAFAHLVEHLPTDQLPTAGGTPALITVNIDLDDLQDKVGAATLTTGTRISSGELRRIACTQGILPMVFNGASLPIDMGRSKDCSPQPNGSRSPTATSAASPPDAKHHPAGAKATTGNTTGPTAPPPTSTTAPSCAPDTTTKPTTKTGNSAKPPTATSKSANPTDVWQRNHRWRP